MNLYSIVNNPSSVKGLIKVSILSSLLISVIYFLAYGLMAILITNKFRTKEYIITNSEKYHTLEVDEKGFLVNPDNYRLPEAKTHINKFHELFWNYNQENYEENISKSLLLADSSVKKIYISLKRSGYYGKIVTQDLKQNLQIRNVKINPKDRNSKLYNVNVRGILYVNRTDQKNTFQKYMLRITFKLVSVRRTDKNPHGFLIKNYNVKMKSMKKEWILLYTLA